MAESSAHKKAKKQAAGPRGRTEVPLTRGRRLDAKTASGKRATEVERSGKRAGLRAAVKRLNDSGSPQKELRVPQRDLELAKEVAKQHARSAMTIKNISGSQRRQVRKPK